MDILCSCYEAEINGSRICSAIWQNYLANELHTICMFLTTKLDCMGQDKCNKKYWPNLFSAIQITKADLPYTVYAEIIF